jgi:ribosomal protein L11 methyltransferase
MLLKLLHKELDEGIRVIDFWCGSGLLGIVCAKFGCDVFHMDDNREALVEAIENGLLNECAVSANEGNRNTKIADIKPADLLVTHQAKLAKLKREIPAVHKLLKQGGTFLLSGWPPDEHRRVRAQVEEFFQIEEIQDLESWPIITARK